MENNLSKAIKFPVRYDGLDGHIYDANGHRILRTLIEGLLTIERADVVGHALAEMINGMGEHLPDTGKVIKECSHPSWAMKRIGGGEMCHKCGKIWGS